MGVELPYLSVAVPFFNEGENIIPFYNKLKDVLGQLNINHELIFVDDGSTDNTFSLAMDLHNKDKSVKVIKLSRNFGQTAALSAGFDAAKGQVIISMDADMQHDPADIPEFLKKIGEGYDIVSGWRKDRVDSFLFRRLPSFLANKIIAWISGVKLHDFGTTFKAYKRGALKQVDLFSELHRFIPALVGWAGLSIAEIPIHNCIRKCGKSKYNLFRTFKVILDFAVIKYLISFIYNPLKIFGSLGLFLFSLGFGIDIVLIILFFMGRIISLWSHGALLLFSLGLIIMGIQFITIGVTAEINARIYHSVRNNKNYMISFKSEDENDCIR